MRIAIWKFAISASPVLTFKSWSPAQLSWPITSQRGGIALPKSFSVGNSTQVPLMFGRLAASWLSWCVAKFYYQRPANKKWCTWLRTWLAVLAAIWLLRLRMKITSCLCNSCPRRKRLILASCLKAGLMPMLSICLRKCSLLTLRSA